MFWLFCLSFLQKAYPGQGGGRETFAGSTELQKRVGENLLIHRQRWYTCRAGSSELCTNLIMTESIM